MMKSVGTRFFIPFGILAVLGSIYIFYHTYESSRKHAYELISQQAAMALEFNLAIRNYAAREIRPRTQMFVDKDTFIPETMSTSFISRRIFEEAEKKFPGYIIRFSADNPRNPINRATPDEQRIMEYFRENPQLNRRIEEIQIEGRRYLAHFAPMVVKQECMPCHSDPKDAPAGLIKRYGPDGGFHKKLRDVAGLDTVAVPVEAINASLASEMRSRSLVQVAVFALLFGSIFYTFRFVVARRLAAMASHFEEIAAHSESPWMTPVEVKGNDEISVVGTAFNKLVEQLRATHASLEQRISERTEELRQANDRLQSELTERKKAEEARRRAQEEFRTTLYSIGDAVLTTDTAGLVKQMNEVAERLTGWLEAEARGRPLEEVFHILNEETRTPVENLVDRVLREGKVVGLGNHTLLIARDGAEHPIVDSGSPIQDESGVVLGVVLVFRDQTQERAAQKALRESEARFRMLVEHIPQRIFLKDQHSVYITCNYNYARDLGIEVDAIAGKTDYDFHPRELAEKYRAGDQRVMASETVETFEEKYVSFERDYWVRTIKVPFRGEDGNIVGVFGIFEDVTTQKRAEEALRESEQKLANIINFLPDATLVIDKEGRVIAWNKAIEEMTGVKAQDILGQGDYEYAIPFYGERRPILIDLVLKPQDEITKYTEVKKEDLTLSGVAYFRAFKGRETYLFGKASALQDLNGNVVGAIQSIRDITEGKRAEAERLRFSKLESLGTLAGGIAHDFNNIITAILGNIGLAALEDKIGPKVRGRLAQAEQACLRAQALSRQLLTFAKGGAPIKKIISIAKLLEESPELILSGSKARAELSIPDDLWSVEADAGQISQVISNLLINADQAMPGGGVIQIRAENIVVEDEPNLPLAKRKCVKITITDEGTGISSKYLDKIFDPYFSTKQKGSGLGLATAYSIVKNHNGHIAVESQLGVGTSFHIYFPATEAEAPAETPETAKPARGQGMVLVMDDDEMVRKVLNGMLSHLGYQADFAVDGTKAIEKFVQARKSGRPFDAMILDLTVPGDLGGKETIEKLREIDPQVKAIVSSGYSDDPIMAEFQKYGFSGVITKPYRVAELSKILQKVINKQAN